MENKLLFYQAASALPDGLSLADYEYRFYKDNAGKTVLSVEIDGLNDGDTIVWDEAEGIWKNAAGGSGEPVLGYNIKFSETEFYSFDPSNTYPGQYFYMYLGTHTAYKQGNYVRLQFDFNNWIEGVVSYVSSPEAFYPQLDLIIFSCVITDTFSGNGEDLLLSYPNAGMSIIGREGAGYSGVTDFDYSGQESRRSFNNYYAPYQVVIDGTLEFYCNPGAYRVGDYVKILPIPFAEYFAPPSEPISPSAEMAETYFAGKITSVRDSLNPGDIALNGVTVEVTDYFVNADVITNQEDWTGWSIGIAAEPTP
jgi:hypothetical protein